MSKRKPLAEFIEEGRAICEAATEGPWEFCEFGQFDDPDAVYNIIDDHPDCLIFYSGEQSKASVRHDDERFAAYARTALPEALDRLEELQAECERLKSIYESAVQSRRELRAALREERSKWKNIMPADTHDD